MNADSSASRFCVKYTYIFSLSGALVMWMAAGFAMLEAGLVRAKNTTEILTKNIVLVRAGLSLLPDHWLFADVWQRWYDNDYADNADFFFQSVLSPQLCRLFLVRSLNV